MKYFILVRLAINEDDSYNGIVFYGFYYETFLLF